jgi:hypothetical protein
VTFLTSPTASAHRAERGDDDAFEPAESDPASGEWPTWLKPLWWKRWGPDVTTAVVLVLAAVALIREARRMWFFADDWEFLLGRRLSGPDPLSQLFSPHNEHWSTLPILMFRALYTVFGVRSYLPYGIAAIAVHLLACLVLRSLLLRTQVNPWLVTAVVTVMAFLGAGSENILWDFQVGFMGSVLFGLLALRLAVADRGSWPSMVGVWAMIVLSLMSSGMAIPMLFAVFFYYLLAHTLRRAVVAASVPLVTYGVWYAAIGHKGTSKTSTPLSDYGKVPDFVVTGLTNIWSSITGVSAIGVALLVALILAPLFDRVNRPVIPLALAGMIAAIGQFSIIGVSRIQFGVADANAERYLYVGAILSLPALALLLTMVSERVRRLRAVGHCLLALAVLLACARGVRYAHDFTTFRVSIQDQLKPQIQGALAIVESGQKTISGYVDPNYSPDVTVARLSRKDVQDAFGHVRPTPQGLIDAAGNIQVGVAAVKFPVAAAQDVIGSNVRGVPTAAGCAGVTITGPDPYVQVAPSPDGSMIAVVLPTTVVQTTLARDGFTSKAVSWGVVPGAVTYVANSTTDAQLRVALPANGPITVCRLG